MEKKYSDEKAIEIIFESLQKLKRGETSFEAFAIGVAMIIDPVPLTVEDIQWAQSIAASLGFEAVEHGVQRTSSKRGKSARSCDRKSKVSSPAKSR